MKKIVVKLAMEDKNINRKALKVIARVKGVDSVSVDMKDKNITVIGEVDPVYLTSKLRRCGFTELLSVGPAKGDKKEREKKEEKKEVRRRLRMMPKRRTDQNFKELCICPTVTTTDPIKMFLTATIIDSRNTILSERRILMPAQCTIS